MALMIEKLLGFVMVLTRISAFFMVLPVFGWQSIPARIKVAMTVLLAIFFSTIIPVPVLAGRVSTAEAVLLIANEATYGLALGLIATFVFTAVKLSGRIIEREMGLAMAEILDPLTGERSQPLGSLLEMIFIMLILSANGHHLFLLIISRSYESFPAGSIPTIPVLTEGIIQASSTMLLHGLKLAAPILAAFLLLMVILAVFARMVPEMDVLFISFPLRIGLGLLMVALFMPFISSFVGEFAKLMEKLLPL
ncbi:MAG: flagellar biosynthetic protein FliR [Planctomycetaceae bacterium]|nr:MAG: flagellar biosynthetic protein FliR [Planctomycetaceae bacterium]